VLDAPVETATLSARRCAQVLEQMVAPIVPDP
jgi:hypothetical protein